MGGEFSNYESALKTSENAAGAAAKKNELLNRTLSSLINVSAENFRELGVVIGEFTVNPIIEKNAWLYKFSRRNYNQQKERIRISIRRYWKILFWTGFRVGNWICF
jgi:hypothetical protein